MGLAVTPAAWNSKASGPKRPEPFCKALGSRPRRRWGRAPRGCWSFLSFLDEEAGSAWACPCTLAGRRPGGGPGLPRHRAPKAGAQPAGAPHPSLEQRAGAGAGVSRPALRCVAMAPPSLLLRLPSGPCSQDTSSSLPGVPPQPRLGPIPSWGLLGVSEPSRPCCCGRHGECPPWSHTVWAQAPPQHIQACGHTHRTRAHSTCMHVGTQHACAHSIYMRVQHS